MAVSNEGTPGKSRRHLLIGRVAITTVSLAGILALVGSAHDAPAALQVSLYIAAAAVLAAGAVAIVVEVRRRRRDPPEERYGSWP